MEDLHGLFYWRWRKRWLHDLLLRNALKWVAWENGVGEVWVHGQAGRVGPEDLVDDCLVDARRLETVRQDRRRVDIKVMSRDGWVLLETGSKDVREEIVVHLTLYKLRKVGLLPRARGASRWNGDERAWVESTERRICIENACR